MDFRQGFHSGHLLGLEAMVIYTELIPKKIQSRIITLLWNKELWSDVASHVTSLNQSVCIISE